MFLASQRTMANEIKGIHMYMSYNSTLTIHAMPSLDKVGAAFWMHVLHLTARRACGGWHGRRTRAGPADVDVVGQSRHLTVGTPGPVELEGLGCSFHKRQPPAQGAKK